MGGKKSIGIGLMGLGVVGGGVARALLEKDKAIAEEIGCPLTLKKILVRDPAKPRSVMIDHHFLTSNAPEILANPEVCWQSAKVGHFDGEHIMVRRGVSDP